MKTINLIDLEKSEIKYKIWKFNDGESQIEIETPIDRKDYYKIICRITNAEELFILSQLGDILNRQEVDFELVITYLMSMRMDRVIEFNRPYTLKIVANVINTIKPRYVYVLEPHSTQTSKLINRCITITNTMFTTFMDANTKFCFPDMGAKKRYINMINGAESFVLDKHRDSNGVITGMLIKEIPQNLANLKHIMVVDDLCDGGRTFIEAAKLLKENYPNVKLSLFITHAVNINGLMAVGKVYDKVYYTESFKEWKGLDAFNIKSIPYEDYLLGYSC